MINPLKNPFQGPGDDDLKKMTGQNPQGLKPKPSSADESLVKSRGGRTGSAGKQVLEDRARSDQELAAKQDAPTKEMEKANTPGPDNTTVRPKATLKKAGWTDSVTRFKTDAEIYAEFDVPASEKERTLTDFQVLRKEKGVFKPYEKAQGHLDETGRVTVKIPIRKNEDPKSTFIIKVKHCTADWSSGQGTEREVSETAEFSFEHTQVSGLHFPKDKSFISDDNLHVFYELKKTFLDWKKSQDKAQIIVYGHSEADKDGDPHPISRSRAMSAFLFVIGDVDQWADLAEKERWGVWEQQCMLRALGFFKAKPTGTRGPKTRQATQDFIAFLNEARCKNINPMLGLTEAYIRKELYREYMNLKREEIELPSSAFRLVSGYPYVGCSAFNRYLGGEELHDENRRAVFVIVQENPNFPVTFPCRYSTIGPCEEQCYQPGERAIKGFRCKHYDDMVKQEKVGNPVVMGDEFAIDWKFIAKMEGTRNDMYVPCDKDGNVLGKSGPTIASGFDLGQLDQEGLENYKFEKSVETKLTPYIGKRNVEAKEFVLKNPLSFSDDEIAGINKKVHEKYAHKAEAFYNESAPPENQFKSMHGRVQTVFASVYFQYGSATKTIRGHLVAEEYKESVNTLLHYTTLTSEAENKTTHKKVNIMQFLSRRCQEARFLLNAISDEEIKSESEKLIIKSEKEWEHAFGKTKSW